MFTLILKGSNEKIQFGLEFLLTVLNTGTFQPTKVGDDKGKKEILQG